MNPFKLLIIALLISGCTATPDKWSKRDYTMQGVVLATSAVDWAQTRSIVDDDDYYERNPLLGENPSKQEVDLFFIGAAIFKTVSVHFTKSKYRPWVQSAYIVGSGAAVYHNHSIGVRINW